MRIIGLDVGRGSAVLCCLDSFPTNIQQLYKQMKQGKQFSYVKCDRLGVESLIKLEPNGLVLEPTGHWYAHFWVLVAKKHDIPVYWIGNTDLDKQRGSYGFVNKRDEEDALCLAACYFDPRFIDNRGNKRFLANYYSISSLDVLRENFLEKEQLQKLRTTLITQLRLRLAVEFPEIVKRSFKISNFRSYSPTVAFIAGLHTSTLLENLYQKSIAHSLDIKLSKYTVDHAKAIFCLDLRISEIYDELEAYLNNDEYSRYIAVFKRFGFGINTASLLLYHVAPFERFLIDGKPWVERELSNGKWQKRDRSLRKFQSFLGLSYAYRTSGNLSSKKFSGSSLVRSHLYAWAICMVAPSKNRINSDVGRVLSDRYQELRLTVKGKDAIIRILFLATRLLYRELLTEFKMNKS